MPRSIRTPAVRSLLGVAFIATLLVASLLPNSPAQARRGSLRGAAFLLPFETFEPTVGATGNGDVYFSTTPDTFVAGWKASIAKSTDGGRKWKDVGPHIGDLTMPPETNDPYIYVDPSTDRVFTFHMSPILTCSIMSFSDDGGKSWTSNPRGCSPTVVWDHQTMVAAKPRETSTFGYPNVLHQCVNAVYAAMCSRSLDGGLTWGPSTVAYTNDEKLVTELCGTQHGHLAAGPDGTVYLPTSECGTNPIVYISRDDGLTWQRSVISKMDTPFVDPSVSVDGKNNIYASFIDESGWLYYSVSRNGGKRWSKPVKIAQGFTTNMPVIVAGDPGKVVIAYPATNDLPQGYKTKGYADNKDPKLIGNVAWGANLTVSYNALDARPKFQTVVATGSDPIGRGRVCVADTRCEFLVDFIEAVIGPDGMPYASFVDGCIGACATSKNGRQLEMGRGLLVTLSSGKRLCTDCWRYGKPKAAYEELLSLANPDESMGYTVEKLSPELQRLRNEAIARRLSAVTGR